MKDEREEVKSNPVSGLLNEALKNIKTYIDMDTLIGDPLSMGEGVVAYPIIKISVGVLAGGGQYANKLLLRKGRQVYPFAGGTGAGFSAEPVGFFVVNKGVHNLITIQNENAFSEAIEKVGEGLSQYLKSLSKKQKKREE